MTGATGNIQVHRVRGGRCGGSVRGKTRGCYAASRRAAWPLLGIACLALVFGVPDAARAAAPGRGETAPIRELLNQDGTLNLATGYSGPLDPAGFRMTARPNGAPRFVAEEAGTAPLAPMSCDPDQSWDDRFYAFGVDSTVLAIAVSGSDVYIGGNFKAINGLVVNHIGEMRDVARNWRNWTVLRGAG